MGILLPPLILPAALILVASGPARCYGTGSGLPVSRRLGPAVERRTKNGRGPFGRRARFARDGGLGDLAREAIGGGRGALLLRRPVEPGHQERKRREQVCPRNASLALGDGRGQTGADRGAET